MSRLMRLAFAVVIVGVMGVAAAQAMHLSVWGLAALVDPPADGVGVNTTASDGCPIQSPDGHALYIASNRPGSMGLDLWVAEREGAEDPWGNPVNLNDAAGADLNTPADEFCPTPVRGNGLFFVRRPSSCGLGDIYFTRFNSEHGWQEPEHLACAPEGPNSPLDEMGPSYVEAGGGARLYFSSSRAANQPGGFVPGDIFVSRMADGGTFGPATLVAELSDPSANDIQPNVRKNGREVVFSSNRAGGKGSQDIWVATRTNGGDAWSQPVNLANLGDASQQVNTSDGETRPSLFRRGETLYFGRAPAAGGPADVYVTTREKARR